jgi:polysaccharide export outer membrane protein
MILDSLGVAEEAPSTWADAEDPKPVDTMVFDIDHILGPGDVIRISIFELFQDSVMFVSDYIVTETGRISIPQVGEIEAEGFTESQLEEEIRQILSPGILKNPMVSVILISSQQRMFSILGDGIPGPGRYIIPRSGFRLAEALAVAGGISQFNISYVYVSRSVTGQQPLAEPSESGIIDMAQTEQLFIPQQQMLERDSPNADFGVWEPQTITPSDKMQMSPQKQQPVITAAEMTTDKELDKIALPERFGKIATEKPAGENILESPIATAQDTTSSEAGQVEWILRDGRWIPVQTGRPKPPEPAIKFEPEKPAPLEQKLPAGFEWDKIGAAGVQTRVIKIPADRLAAGDLRYNIVIRAGDTIYVPVDIIGEFCIMGNVNGQGYINTTGRPMTLKMAIAAAGGLGPLAWPKRCEVVRRIGRQKEEIVMVDLDKIARGEQPDFFIKPNDLIRVGTHPTARWRAVLRNAFRATYGFGFVYDRNFADRDYYTHRPFPDWF